MARISIIIPIYNEQDNLRQLSSKIIALTKLLPYTFEIIFINDGSVDGSLSIIKDLTERHEQINFINLSRNFGQQNALRAGYEHARGDAVISMDADMQNPPELIEEMIKKWDQGFDVVTCKRKEGKQAGGILKEITSKLFYLILTYLSEVKIDRNTPDFRLLDRKLVDILSALPEREIFLRGIISWMGFKKTTLEYSHGERQGGKTGYSYLKMMKLAVSGLTSFSIKPLYAAIYMGITISIASLAYIVYALVQHYQGNTISGWSSLIIAVTFLGGLQLFVLGIIGIYLGKLFLHAKSRPDYIISEKNIKLTFQNINPEKSKTTEFS